MTTRQDRHGKASHHGHERWAVIAFLTVLGLVITALDVVAPRPAAAAVADAYEPDDTAATANPLTVDGPVQQHTIAPDAGDEDWVAVAVAAGTTYLLETTGGSPDESMDTVLRLYDADGSTPLAYDDDGGDGVYSRIEYSADVSKTVFVRVTGFESGAYALSVSSVVPPGSLTGLANGVNLGNVLVGSAKQVTIQVQNTGGGPVTVGQVSLSRPGWSIVRNEVVGTIPAGATRELEVRYAPTAAYQGAPVAEYHEWTNLVAQYLYSGGVLTGAVVYSGFQNLGGVGVLPWHVTACQPSSPAPCNPVFNRSGSAAVVAGGRYNVRTVISAVPGTGRVALLAPVTDSVSLNARPTGLSGLTYVRVPDAYVTIESDDPDSPTYVDLFGVALATSAEVPERLTDHPVQGRHQQGQGQDPPSQRPQDRVQELQAGPLQGPHHRPQRHRSRPLQHLDQVPHPLAAPGHVYRPGVQPVDQPGGSGSWQSGSRQANVRSAVLRPWSQSGPKGRWEEHSNSRSASWET